jgi:hypothetical protein
MGIGSFPGIKRFERGADHTNPSSGETANGWSYTSTSPPFLNTMTWDYLSLFNPIPKPLPIIF